MASKPLDLQGFMALANIFPLFLPLSGLLY